MKDKEQRYKKLVERVSNCHCCKDIKIPVYQEDCEFLTNYNKNIERVNLWNCWQGNLNAKIMLIGQDYGRYNSNGNEEFWRINIEPGSIEDEHMAVKKKWGATDSNLFYLFKKVLGYDLTKKCDGLFFTNVACCYRKNNISGSSTLRTEWLSLCANKYLGELIDIISPEVIIVLGEKAFNALACVDDARIECEDSIDNDKKISRFKELIEHEYNLVFKNNKTIRVFPVYHPGAYSTINRPLAEQEKDWKKIKDYLK